RTKFKTLDLCSNEAFHSIFTSLVGSAAALSSEDNNIVMWFLNNIPRLKYPKEIPFKETLCMLAGHFLAKKLNLLPIVKTSTDVLRIISHISGGDISLVKNTKFKSLPRSQRRMFCNLLEAVGKEDDFAKHKNKWVKAFHSLHIGDYKKSFPKTYGIATKLRNGIKIETFN